MLAISATRWLLRAVCACSTLTLVSIHASAQTTVVSVASDGTQANNASLTYLLAHPALSADGRYVAFSSLASNLVLSDTNGKDDVFVRDRLTSQTTRVSVASDGTQANDMSFETAISGDGRYVVFASWATNLVQGDTNICNEGTGDHSCSDVFVHDRVTGQTTRVSSTSSGVAGNGASTEPIVSVDGHVVAFRSTASDLVAGDTNGISDVFVRDLTSGQTTRVNVTSQGGQAEPGPSPFWVDPSYAALSADGRFVAFASNQGNLVPGDANVACVVDLVGTVNCPDVFVHDRLTGQTTRVSVASDGTEANFGASDPVISADGRFVGFRSHSTNLGGAGLTGCAPLSQVYFSNVVYVHDRVTGQTSPATPPPARCEDFMFLEQMSADGRYIQFATEQPLVPSDTNLLFDIYVVDRSTNALALASIGHGGSASNGTNGRGALTGDGRYAAFLSHATNLLPAGTDLNGFGDVFVGDLFDSDGDTMTNDWEAFFGFNPNDGADGNLDADSDGRTNAQEFAAGTHPKGLASATRFFAEGASTDFFNTRMAVANPSLANAAQVLLRFLKSDGTFVTELVTIPPQQIRKVLVDDLPGMSPAEFSTVVESNTEVVVDRMMWWTSENAYGNHAETALTAAAPTWYFAEGSTNAGFQLFYLIQNPGDTVATVQAKYLLPSGAPVNVTYDVAPHSRFTIWANLLTALQATDVSAVFSVTSGPAIIVERAMYLSSGGQQYAAGHEAAGVTALNAEWTFAEGATGEYFDLFVLVSNPNATAAQVEATYLLPNGTTRQKTYTLGANSRFTIWVDIEEFGGVQALAKTAVSTVIRSTNGVPIVAERAMWWPGSSTTWVEAHDSFGATVSGPRWAFADGVVGGAPGNTDTFILIANQSAAAADVTVTLLFSDGRAPLSKVFTVAGTSRYNVWARIDFDTIVEGDFGAIIQAANPSTPLVVERAVYNDADGVHWAAGANALATRLSP